MTHPHTSFYEFFPLGGRLLTSRIMARKDVDTETPPQACQRAAREVISQVQRFRGSRNIRHCPGTMPQSIGTCQSQPLLRGNFVKWLQRLGVAPSTPFSL